MPTMYTQLCSLLYSHMHRVTQTLPQEPWRTRVAGLLYYWLERWLTFFVFGPDSSRRGWLIIPEPDMQGAVILAARERPRAGRLTSLARSYTLSTMHHQWILCGGHIHSIDPKLRCCYSCTYFLAHAAAALPLFFPHLSKVSWRNWRGYWESSLAVGETTSPREVLFR